MEEDKNSSFNATSSNFSKERHELEKNNFLALMTSSKPTVLPFHLNVMLNLSPKWYSIDLLDFFLMHHETRARKKLEACRS